MKPFAAVRASVPPFFCPVVVPAQAGTQGLAIVADLDSRLRGNDGLARIE
jgi:hypothetical protein